MAAHDIAPPSEILAALQGVVNMLEDCTRWQVVRARNADLIAAQWAYQAEQHIVDAAASLRYASQLLLGEIHRLQRADQYREACDRG